jgi:hypothetical protein
VKIAEKVASVRACVCVCVYMAEIRRSSRPFAAYFRAVNTMECLSVRQAAGKCSADKYKHYVRCWSAMDSYRGADKALARPGRKQATTTEDFDIHISYL